MLLKSIKNVTGIARYLAHSASPTNEPTTTNEKHLTFDLKYAIKQYDRNYEQVKPLVTVTHESSRSRYKKPVIVFPGFEGRIASVEPAIKNLNRTVHCLQYPFENSKNNICEITDFVEQVLKENGLLDENEINVLGHSYGGIIAVDLIRRLESIGKKIRLCLTDSSPYAIRIMTTRSFGDVQRSDEFQKKLLLNVANSVQFQDYEMLEDLLKSNIYWQDKINTIIPLIAEKTDHDVDHLKTIAVSLRKILHAIYYYNDSDVNLEAETTLIRSSIKILPFPKDFKLAKICKKPVKEFYADGHHMSMLKFSRTADLINNTFDDEIK